MGYDWAADYGRTYLMPPALDDWIGPDHPARFVRSFVERFSSKEWQIEERRGGFGRPAYEEELLLKLWMYAYLRGIFSSRGVERACREMVPFMWLAGEHRPDHNTLRRFWTGHQRTIGRVFELGLDVSREMELVGLELQAVDGTKIQACGSPRSMTTREQLERRGGAQSPEASGNRTCDPAGRGTRKERAGSWRTDRRAAEPKTARREDRRTAREDRSESAAKSV